MKDLQIKKLYYSISEVSKMVGLEQYVLRYWETEFEQLKPQKNRAGNRIYTEKDISTIRLIKKLTRGDRYTIEGARQVLSQFDEESAQAYLNDGTLPGEEAGSSQGVSRELLTELRERLMEMKQMIAGAPAERVAGEGR